MNNSRGLRARVDTAAGWTSDDPTLESGMIGIESDTGRMKRGDGSTAWTSLGYVAAASSHTHSSADVAGGTLTTRATVLEIRDTFGIFN